jgi:hypothetical protein
MPSSRVRVPTDAPEVSVVEVADELRQPLEDLSQTLGQPPTRIVNLALAEYLERQLRPDRRTSGSTSSYVEMTAREDLHDVF